jgi:hypothetical protein
MRLRLLVLAAVALVAVPSLALAHPAKPHPRGHHQQQQAAAILGTWDVRVTVNGQAPFPALLTFNRGGGVVETESDQPGTGLGAWQRTGANTYAVAFKTFIFTPTGDPGGWVVVRSMVTLTGDTLSGPFKFDVFDPTGKVVQSGSGTATATRFAIPAL